MTSIHARAAAVVLVLVFASFLGLAGSSRPGDAAAQSSDVTIHDAWARATPAGVRMGAMYLTLESVAGDRLLRARVPRSVASGTEIHETVVIPDTTGAGGSRMTMRPVDSIELPPGEPVEFKPGGYHIMLIGLKKPLEPGAHVGVTLFLEKAGKLKATATVRGE